MIGDPICPDCGRYLANSVNVFGFHQCAPQVGDPPEVTSGILEKCVSAVREYVGARDLEQTLASTLGVEPPLSILQRHEAAVDWLVGFVTGVREGEQMIQEEYHQMVEYLSEEGYEVTGMNGVVGVLRQLVEERDAHIEQLEEALRQERYDSD